MGKTFNGLDEVSAEVYMERDYQRTARRSARETFMERGAVFQGRTIRQDASGEGTKGTVK